jgi:hypothetical protein
LKRFSFCRQNSKIRAPVGKVGLGRQVAFVLLQRANYLTFNAMRQASIERRRRLAASTRPGRDAPVKRDACGHLPEPDSFVPPVRPFGRTSAPMVPHFVRRVGRRAFPVGGAL